MKYRSSRIINSNGTLYKVGWDEHGWFTIDTGDFYEDEEGEAEWWSDDSPLVSFSPDGTDELIAAIREEE